MAIPVYEEAATWVYGSGVTSVTPSYSTLTTINADDILVIIACARVNTGTAQYDDSTLKPTGYTLINHVGSTTSACHTAAWYKVATGSETSTISVPNNDAANVRCTILRFSGADTTTVIDTVGADFEAGNATTHAVTGHTTNTANSLAVALEGHDAGVANTADGGASWTEQADEIASGNPGVSWGTRDMAAAGATGAYDVTISASQGCSGFTFSILEAAAAGGGASKLIGGSLIK